MWCIALGPSRIITSFLECLLGKFLCCANYYKLTNLYNKVASQISVPIWSALGAAFFGVDPACLFPTGLHGKNLVKRMINPNWWFGLPFPTSRSRCDSGLIVSMGDAHPMCIIYGLYMRFIISFKKTGRQRILPCKFTPRRFSDFPWCNSTKRFPWASPHMPKMCPFKTPTDRFFLVKQWTSCRRIFHQIPAGFGTPFTITSLPFLWREPVKLVEIREELSMSRSTTAEIIPVTSSNSDSASDEWCQWNRCICGLHKVSQPKDQNMEFESSEHIWKISPDRPVQRPAGFLLVARFEAVAWSQGNLWSNDPGPWTLDCPYWCVLW